MFVGVYIPIQYKYILANMPKSHRSRKSKHSKKGGSFSGGAKRRSRRSKLADAGAKGGKKASGYVDTGVTLIAGKPVSGVDSKDTKVGLDLCWGNK